MALLNHDGAPVQLLMHVVACQIKKIFHSFARSVCQANALEVFPSSAVSSLGTIVQHGLFAIDTQMNLHVHTHRPAAGSSFHRCVLLGYCNSSRSYSRSSHVCNALRKIGNNPQRSYAFEVNLQRLMDSEFTPNRHIGPVEVAGQPGRGRCVIAKEDLPHGSLLFISEPIGSVLTGQLGQQLQPQHLLQHWQTTKPGLSAADRLKLSLLYRPDAAASALPQISFKDFSNTKATTKAKKAAVKGFGGAAAKQQAGGTTTAAAAATELSDEQLEAVLRCNAFGDDHIDGALTYCRQEQQQSAIGVFPEFSLLNHSCVPNTTAAVLLKDRLLVRTAVVVPAGKELTTSYLGLAGGIPRKQRQQLLQQSYGFACNCNRCKAETEAPQEITTTLEAMHEWSSTIDAPQLLSLFAQGDSSMPTLQDIYQKAAQFVDQLEQQLKQVEEPMLAYWLRASAYGTYALLLRTGEFLAGKKDAAAANKLADLVRVFAPASDPHLLLLSDNAIRAAEAAAAAGAAATAEQETKLAVAQLVRTLALRYGEAKNQELLTQLAGSLNASLSPHWLGLYDLDGSMGLQTLLVQLEQRKHKSRSSGENGSANAVAEKQKVELGVEQLGTLQQGG